MDVVVGATDRDCSYSCDDVCDSRK